MVTLARTVVAAAAVLSLAIGTPVAHASDTAEHGAAGLLPGRRDAVIAADRLVSLGGFTRRTVSGAETTVFGVGPADGPTSAHDVPRLSVDVLVTDVLTVGGGVIFSLPSRNASVTAGAAPRVGFLFSLSRRVALWPKAGVTYLFTTSRNPPSSLPPPIGREGPTPAPAWQDGDFHQVALVADAQLLFALVEHVGMTLGLGLGAPLAGSFDPRGNAGGFANDLQVLHVGAYGGLAAWF